MTDHAGKIAYPGYSGDCRLSACPSPFSIERIERVVPAGVSLADILKNEGIYTPYARVWVGDIEVPFNRLRLAYPGTGAQIVVRVVPSDGGDKDPFRTILMVVVMVAAAWAGPAGAAAMGLTGTSAAVGGALISAGVGIAGSLAINALIPPPKLSGAAAIAGRDSYAISGGKNQAIPWGTCPQPYGTLRYYPYYAALPYTESLGDRSYYRMLFYLCVGGCHISDIRIGDTPASQYLGFQYSIGKTEVPPIHYSNDVDEESITALLPSYSLATSLVDYGGWVNNAYTGADEFQIIGQYTTYAGNHAGIAWTSRTTGLNADEISIDLAAPKGCMYIRREGRRGKVQIDVYIEYRPVGGAWSAFSGASVVGSGQNLGGGKYRLEGADSGMFRIGIIKSVTQGQYEIRMKRTATTVAFDDKDVDPFTEAGQDALLDDIYWSILRTVRHTAPVTLPNVSLLAVRIQATDQLNGVLDSLNLQITKTLGYEYNGSAWVPGGTPTNPAWIYTDILTGAANKRALATSRLDGPSLKAWADACTAAGLEYNAVMDGSVSVFDRLKEVCAAGKAAWGMKDGDYSVVRDVAQTTPVQHFTPRNSWGYQGSKVFTDRPHALKVQFSNKDKNHTPDELTVYDDGYTAANATKFETMPMPGVDNVAQAWKLARFHIAVARLRPEQHAFYADVENIICTRGDLIRFNHDVPLFGLHSGRVKSISGQDVTLDEKVLFEAGKAYSARFRCSDGTSVVSAIVNPGAGEYSEITASGSIAGAAVGDLFMFGESALESVELIVKRIEPGSDLTARLVCVDAAPAVHTADSGTIPAFDSQITMPVDRQSLPAPVPAIENIQSDEFALFQNPDGTLAPRIIISYTVPSTSFNPAGKIEAQFRKVGGSWREAELGAAGTVIIGNVNEGQYYDLRLRSVSVYGVPSAWVTALSHLVIGKTSLPRQVTGFGLSVIEGNAHLQWDRHPDIDVRVGGSFLIRHTTLLTGYTWEDGQSIGPSIPGNASSAVLPLLLGTYMIKAQDSGERLSSTLTAITTTIPSVIQFNAVATSAQSPLFTGQRTNLVTDDGALKLVGVDTVDDHSETLEVDEWGYVDTLGGVFSFGEYLFDSAVDLGDIYTSRVTATIETQTYIAEDLIDSRTDNLDLWGPFDGAVVSDSEAILNIRTTEDDPAASPTWGIWQRFSVGDYRARGLEFRVTYTNPDPIHNVQVSSLSVAVDMPDRVESGENVSAPSGGMSVAFAHDFRVTPAIGITAENMGTGDYYTITNKSVSGFDIRFFNSSAVGVARTFDWQAKGYGKI